jgi:hypothetical protein
LRASVGSTGARSARRCRVGPGHSGACVSRSRRRPLTRAGHETGCPCSGCCRHGRRAGVLAPGRDRRNAGNRAGSGRPRWLRS